MHASHQLAITAIEAARTLPEGFWGRAALVVLALGSVVYICRMVVRTNRVVLSVMIFVGLSTLVCSWVYNRNEPKLITPFIERLSQFFPAAPHDPGRRSG